MFTSALAVNFYPVWGLLFEVSKDLGIKYNTRSENTVDTTT